jgi:hypothetical protein
VLWVLLTAPAEGERPVGWCHDVEVRANDQETIVDVLAQDFAVAARGGAGAVFELGFVGEQLAFLAPRARRP